MATTSEDQDPHKLIIDTFKRFDSNGDGVISRSELKRVLQAISAGSCEEQAVDDVLTAADSNKDGKIQYEEFVSWVLQGVHDAKAQNGGTELGAKEGKAQNNGKDTNPPMKKEPEPAALSDKERFTTAPAALPEEKKGKQEDPGFDPTKSCPLARRGSIQVDFRSFCPERYEVDIKQRYDLDKLTIGEGGYGKVFIATDKTSGRRVAVKKVTRTSGESMECLTREIDIMKELDHPNICKLLATFQQAKNMFFIMELCEGGELFDRIIDTGSMDQGKSAVIVQQVCTALAYAHGRGIAHRDIKPENVVFCSKDPDDQSVKLIDWGLAVAFTGASMNSSVGSFTYAAPEVLESRDVTAYTQSCDLWSTGVLTYVMLCGKPPFWGSRVQFLKNAKAEKYPMKSAPWNTMNPHAKDFVIKLLKADPKRRMTMKDTLDHDWMKYMAEQKGDSEEHCKLVLENIKMFNGASQFAKMCISAVARQLDHTHLRGIHQVFRELDANGDGVLSMEEVSGGFKRIFGPDSQEVKQVKSLFEGLDLDGSNSIDYTEFCAAGLGFKTATQEDMLWAAFKTFDVDNSGSIELNDISEILDLADVQDAWSAEVCKEVGAELLTKYDKDKDGKINFEDWKQMMTDVWSKKGAVVEDEEEEPESRTLQRTLVGGMDLNPYNLLLQVNKLPS